MRPSKPLFFIYFKCGVLIFAGALAYLVYHVHIVSLGYEMGQMQKEKKELERIHTQLQVEIASLASLDRIEQIAVNRLGMAPSGSEQKIMVTELDKTRKTPPVELAQREFSFRWFK